MKLVLVLAILLGGMATFATSQAKSGEYETKSNMVIAEVLTYWEVVTNKYVRVEGNHQYKEIRFRTGFDYTENKENITTHPQKLLGNTVYAYTQTYSTY